MERKQEEERRERINITLPQSYPILVVGDIVELAKTIRITL